MEVLKRKFRIDKGIASVAVWLLASFWIFLRKPQPVKNLSDPSLESRYVIRVESQGWVSVHPSQTRRERLLFLGVNVEYALRYKTTQYK